MPREADETSMIHLEERSVQSRSGEGDPRRDSRRGGFTLIELLIVVVIIGILATIALPQFDDVRQRAFNSAMLSDLRSASYAIEEYFSDNFALPDENQLINAGFAFTPGVSFRTFSIRDGNDPDKARVHIHIEHDGSLHYYHYEYPGTSTPEKRWK